MTAVGKDPCPRCGSVWVMVERVNRRDATEFWGCSRFPACRGTRPRIARASQATPDTKGKPRLSTGVRSGGWADDVELALARLTGRNFGVLTGCVLRPLLIAVVIVLSSNLAGPLSNWIGHYMADVFVQ
jgi:ssDNA-binding Zn-finger/Zn-ribbon topoisomerase 1